MYITFDNYSSFKACAEPDSFIRGGPTLTTFFLPVDEGRDDPITTKCGPLSVRQRNVICMAFRCRADDDPLLNTGLVALWFFQEIRISIA